MSESKSRSKSKSKSSLVPKTSRNSIVIFPNDDQQGHAAAELLTKKENAQTAQKIIERLSYLLPQHRDILEKSKKSFNDKLVTQRFKKLSDLSEMINLHRDLLNQCHVILCSALLYQFTVETMNTLWLANVTIKHEAKAIVQNNKAEMTRYSSVLDHLQSLKVRKEVLIDDVHYYRNLWRIHKSDQDEKMFEFENEIWAILTAIPSDASIPTTLFDIDDELNENTVSIIESKLRMYVLEGRLDESIGSIILLLGKRCLYLDAPKVCQKIIKIAIDILLKFCEKDSIKFNLLPMAEAFVVAYQNHYGNALALAKSTLESISCLETASDEEKEYLRFQLAYFIVKWDGKEDGMAVLEETASFFEQNIPNTEQLWRSNVNILARFYNEQFKSEIAYNHVEKIIKKYHTDKFGEINSKNKTICDIANELLSKSSASSRLMQTVSLHLGPLPMFVMESVREIIIHFATKRNFNAVYLVENYLKECIQSYQSNPVCEETNDTELDFKVIAKKNKKRFTNPIGKKLKNVIKK